MPSTSSFLEPRLASTRPVLASLFCFFRSLLAPFSSFRWLAFMMYLGRCRWLLILLILLLSLYFSISLSRYSPARYSLTLTLPVGLQATVFHILRFMSSEPERRQWESTVNWTADTTCIRLAWQTSLLMPESKLKRRRVLSKELLANCRPDEAKSRSVTAPMCPLWMSLALSMRLRSKEQQFPSSLPAVRFIGSRGLKQRAIDLLARVIFWTGVSPRRSYSRRERSEQEAARRLGSEGLYLALRMLSTFHSSWQMGLVRWQDHTCTTCPEVTNSSSWGECSTFPESAQKYPESVGSSIWSGAAPPSGPFRAENPRECAPPAHPEACSESRRG